MGQVKGGGFLKWDIRRTDITGSTNEDAFALGRSGAPAGTVCLSESQLRGRGRMDRTWFSPPGVGLYCSVLLRPVLPPEDAGLLSLCSALAMADTLRASGLMACIKWPNDIVFEGRKLCGILSVCDADASGLHFAVIGCGLNLLPGSYPEEIRSHAACISEFGIHTNREDLLYRYLAALESNVTVLETDGFTPLRQRLESRSALLSRHVFISGGQEAEGICEGIGKHGELLIRENNGSLLSITCGDVSVRGENGYV